jgi:cytosine/adenosine deaminase-related metal-dependent hydrolase
MSFYKTPVQDTLSVVKADWLVNGTAAPMADCAVIVADNGTIHDAGSRRILEQRYDFGKMQTVDMSGHIIMPALVNAHTHLYYSAFRNQLPLWYDFIGWIEGLLTVNKMIAREDITAGISKYAALMYRRGISLIGNICSDYFWDAGITAKSRLRGINFLEVTDRNYGSNQFFNNAMMRVEAANKFKNARFRYALTPHSIYSCQPHIIKKISDYNLKRSIPICIHLAESAEETELVRTGKGRMKDFLSQRGIETVFGRKKYKSPVRYMDAIGNLNSNILAIHLVHLDEEDINILADNGVRVVTCPGSNRFLQAGVAPLERLLAAGISISIGTDSVAGNDDLDIFREMRIIRDEHPSIPSSEIIKMATINGAKALGWNREYGSIEKGKKADLIALPLPVGRAIANACEVEEYIVTECLGDDVTRLNLQV